jgi:hypothetical protein
MLEEERRHLRFLDTYLVYVYLVLIIICQIPRTFQNSLESDFYMHSSFCLIQEPGPP